jgi:hypothetical protein
MPSSISADLYAAAQIISERGLWNQPYAYGADTDNGPVDPVAALWIAAHGNLPYVFTASAPGFTDTATEMVMDDDRVRAAVEFLSANLTEDDTTITDDEPVERIAHWVTKSRTSEVIGRMIRIAEPTHSPVRRSSALTVAA